MKANYITLDEAVLEAGFKTKSMANFPNYIQPNVERVKLADVRIARMVDTDEGIQRMVTAVAEKVYLGFDIKYYMFPLIGRSKDGSLWALDGGNRLVGARAGGVQYADCVVIDIDGAGDAADAFLTINAERKQISSPIRTWAKHISGNDPKATMFVKSIEKAGFELHEKKGHLRIKAATGIMVSAGQYDYENFVNAMLAYKQIWPTHDEVNADVIRGLMFLIWAYRRNAEPQKVTAAMLTKNINGVMLPFLLIPKIVNAGAKKFNHSDRDYRRA